MLLGFRPGHVQQSQHLNVCLLDRQFSSASLPIFHNSLSIFMLVYLHVYLLFSPSICLCVFLHVFLPVILLYMPGCLYLPLSFSSPPLLACVSPILPVTSLSVWCVCFHYVYLPVNLCSCLFFNIHVYLVKCFCLSVLLGFSLNSIIVFTLCGKLFSVKVCESKSKLVT